MNNASLNVHCKRRSTSKLANMDVHGLENAVGSPHEEEWTQDYYDTSQVLSKCPVVPQLKDIKVKMPKLHFHTTSKNTMSLWDNGSRQLFIWIIDIHV